MACCNEDLQLLPEDVTIEILSRLPVKSLIRAKTVCKNWYNVIISSSFVTKHFNNPNNTGHLFVNRYDKLSSRFVFSLFPDRFLAGSPPVYEDVAVDVRNHLLVSASNGILCLSNRNNWKRFALWNPATREFRSVPVYPRIFPPNVASSEETFGFGFDSVTNDCKLVWIWNSLDVSEMRYGPYQVAVYTLSTDSWRYLDVVLPYSSIATPRTNTCINGVHYWFAIDKEDRPLILSFNMNNELFHETLDIPSSKLPVLVPYDNTLALMYYDQGQVSVWVMREEGGWKKQFSIEPISHIRLPFGFWKNGELITEIGDGHLALHDPETHEIKYLGPPIWAHCLVYRESLVAIRSGHGFLEQDQYMDEILNFSKTEFSSS